jgi:thiol-disulfide isomerase/thioredoxin
MASRRRKRSSKAKRKKGSSKANLPLVVGITVAVIGIIGFGVGQLRRTQAAPQAVSSLSRSSSEATLLEAAPANRAEASAQTGEAVDDLVRYLGPETNPDGLLQAESGAFDQPTLVWFHADWCHVCQRIKPEVVGLGEAYEGRVNFVRLNVDSPSASQAVRQYRVRATPTFVLFDASGQILANVPGWPGYGQFVNAFDQLLAGS